MPHSLFNALLQKFHAGTLDEQEAIRFRDLLLSGACDELLKDAVEQRLQQPRSPAAFTDAKKQLLLQQLLQHIQQPPEKKQARVVRWWWAAAAAVLVLLGGYWFFKPAGPHSPGPGMAKKVPDINAPEKSTAYITLADGRQVLLDSLARDVISIGSGTGVYKNADGQISYQGAPAVATVNTLTVPRGSRPVGLVLPDGSKVWLDAGSALSYPTGFTGTERRVTLTGQGYFEVARMNAPGSSGTMLPFMVTSGEITTKVLGTHFNVNAYKEEGMVKVTLLEGHVKVAPEGGGDEVDVKPGQQAQWTGGHLKLDRSPDLDEVMAWRSDRFYFNGTDIRSVMQQVGRWYDAEIVFKEPFSHSCVADLPRNMPVSELLKIIELTGVVHFKIENMPHKKITVSR
ncbi:FecR family protein [Niabella drilacis]|uniref:FecR family protein n=1 Tax=Niabella drilacis (strain DSM 25811 / CCM 8410 / CCUG 62505 / LMG 26954 / E90) TaxID=1285928 RepID=A0A1G6MVP3_NIADE|nr:FecR family protein [Niabella drilacis]SDC59277.1 FecR family protein [Niabella drilacis]